MSWRAIIAVVALACFQQNLLATSCAAPPPPCALLGSNGVFFIGVVTDVRVEANDLYPVHIRFQVGESFAGLEPGVTELTVAQADRGMEKGLSYLVNARRLGDRLIVGPCSLSGLVGVRASYVDYLRRAASGDLPPTASLMVRAPDWYGTVRVVGPDGELTVQTDLDGVAKLEGIKPGRYRLIYDGPRYRLTNLVDDVEASAGSCPSLILGLR
ncbi:MAG TPA: hypothetical protein VGG72_30800 [Bryobacteraceae bacterium]